METFNFYTAYTQLRELYGVELTPDQFETMGMIAWSKIGNRFYTLKTDKVEVIDGFATIPCNVDEVEAVTTDNVPYQQSSAIKDHYNMQTEQYVENYIENTKGDQSPLYTRGNFVKFTKAGPSRIQVHQKSGTVNVLYKSVLYDEQGLPELNAKEVDAIAAYCAYADAFKKCLMTRNGDLANLAQVLEQKWLKLCDHARTPVNMTQNDMDMIGDVVRSWDRKTYKNSYKPIR